MQSNILGECGGGWILGRGDVVADKLRGRREVVLRVQGARSQYPRRYLLFLPLQGGKALYWGEGGE